MNVFKKDIGKKVMRLFLKDKERFLIELCLTTGKRDCLLKFES